MSLSYYIYLRRNGNNNFISAISLLVGPFVLAFKDGPRSGFTKEIPSFLTTHLIIFDIVILCKVICYVQFKNKLKGEFF